VDLPSDDLRVEVWEEMIDVNRKGVLYGILRSRSNSRPMLMWAEIAKTFPFDKIADAHRYLESNEQFGEVVVTI
jgi:hypothetical protein